MNKAIILHGTLGSPEGNWFRWLEAELKDKGIEAWLPQLPRAEQPKLSEWLEFVAENCPFAIDEQTLVVGHSSGALLALALSGYIQQPIGAVVGVSAFYKIGVPIVATDWGPNAALFDYEPDWDFIRGTVNNRLLLHSDDDPYIPLEVAKSLAARLEAELITIPGQGHFNLEKSEVYYRNDILLSLLRERGLVPHESIMIVDEQDSPIGEASMQEAQDKGLWHRVVRCVVQDAKGRWLLQKRQSFLFTNPGKWDMSATGHVDPGEDYEAAAHRELKEEVGIDRAELVEWFRETTEFTKGPKQYRRFNRTYKVPYSGQVITPNLAEVSEAKWFTRVELEALLDEAAELASEKLIELITRSTQHNNERDTDGLG
ncbi:MAG TPA: NUDIX domain-containing protein [Candidatus Saccharibacteria bacterium]|nr:NUDIX domain-containing protein [Candidatus Saccharibacteria bacterium]